MFVYFPDIQRVFPDLQTSIYLTGVEAPTLSYSEYQVKLMPLKTC